MTKKLHELDLNDIRVLAGLKPLTEDCDQEQEENDDGECSPFTHADDNVDMVRDDVDESIFDEDFLLPPKDDDDDDDWDARDEPELDRQTNFDAPSRYDGDDSYDLYDDEQIEEAASRKDFRMVADLISKIEDPELRRSSAEDHAKMFALQNPRFNKDLFMKAAGVETLGEDSVVAADDALNALYYAQQELASSEDRSEYKGILMHDLGKVIDRMELGDTAGASSMLKLALSTANKLANNAYGFDEIHQTIADVEDMLRVSEGPGDEFDYDDDAMVDVGDDEDFETFDFDDEFEREMGNTNRFESVVEMNQLRKLAGMPPIAEEAKPDFADIDDDGDEEESMKKAAKDKEEKVKESLPDHGNDYAFIKFNDDKAYFLVADEIGDRIIFGMNNEVGIPEEYAADIGDLLVQYGFGEGTEKDGAWHWASMDENLQNGYGDHEYADSYDDYFPRGSHQSPSNDLGPTAGELGDNPMRSPMASTDRDEVYESMKQDYRRFRLS